MSRGRLDERTPLRGYRRKTKAFKIVTIQEGDSHSEAGMTMEPGDAETCLHVSISEANMSSPFRGMTGSGGKASSYRLLPTVYFLLPTTHC